MAASNQTQAFAAGTVERLLDEFRATNDAVEALFRVHQGQEHTAALTREQIEDALGTLNANVTVAFDRGNQHTEYLYYEGGNWYSLTQTSSDVIGPIPLYPHNVSDRLGAHELSAVKTTQSPFTQVDLPAHDLDETEVDADV